VQCCDAATDQCTRLVRNAHCFGCSQCVAAFRIDPVLPRMLHMRGVARTELHDQGTAACLRGKVASTRLHVVICIHCRFKHMRPQCEHGIDAQLQARVALLRGQASGDQQRHPTCCMRVHAILKQIVVYVGMTCLPERAGKLPETYSSPIGGKPATITTCAVCIGIFGTAH
jgi:hypothetical protein